MVDRRYEGVDGLFVHPVEDEAVMAGQRHDRARALRGARRASTRSSCPWGGGGLTTGIASAVKALRPGVRVVTAEPATAAPLAASLAAGAPAEIDYRPSFVDGAGGRALLPDDVGARAGARRRRGRGAARRVAAAVRLLATRARVVAEGAGALALAAALRGAAGEGRVVCIVSGGNIDADVLAAILSRSDLTRSARTVLDRRDSGSRARNPSTSSAVL